MKLKKKVSVILEFYTIFAGSNVHDFLRTKLYLIWNKTN